MTRQEWESKARELLDVALNDILPPAYRKAIDALLGETPSDGDVNCPHCGLTMRAVDGGWACPTLKPQPRKRVKR